MVSRKLKSGKLICIATVLLLSSVVFCYAENDDNTDVDINSQIQSGGDIGADVDSRSRSEEDVDSKTRLERAIAMIQATKIDDEISETEKAADKPTEAVKEESNETKVKIVKVDPEKAHESNKIKNNTEYVIEKEISDQIEELIKEPVKATNPYLIANILFECGRVEEASVFYKETYRRLEEGNTKIKAEKDWVLMQTGNCLQNNNKVEAMEAYKQLVNTAPNSEWADIARAQIKLLSWYVDNNVEELLSQDVTSIAELE
jgi:tetratricopeptide (TPR) repeat protein